MFRNRLISVPVIDRGPYANGADWDLTMATARALGMRQTATIGALRCVDGFRAPSDPGPASRPDRARASHGADPSAPRGTIGQVAQELITIAEARARIAAAAGPPLGSERVGIGTRSTASSPTIWPPKRAGAPFACSAMDGYALGPGPTPGTSRLIGESRAGLPVAGLASRSGAGSADLDRRGGAGRDPRGRPAGGHRRAGRRRARRSPAPRSWPATTSAARARTCGRAIWSCPRDEDRPRRDRRRRRGWRRRADRRAPPARQHPLHRRRAQGAGSGARPGEIHNSNEPMLRALAQRAGAALAPGGRVPTTPRATEAALARALEQCDVLVVSGGVSVGPHDHVRPALERLGVVAALLGRRAPARPPDLVRQPRQAARVRASRQPGVRGRHVLAVRARRRSTHCSARGRGRRCWSRASLAVDVRRNGVRDQAIRVELAVLRRSARRDAHGRAGLAPADLARAGRRARADPLRRGGAAGRHDRRARPAARLTGAVVGANTRRSRRGAGAGAGRSRDLRSPRSPAWLARRRLKVARSPVRLLIISPPEVDGDRGRRRGPFRAVGPADALPEQELDRLWSPANLENLGRTYWRFLSRVTLGLIRVVYSEGERAVVLLGAVHVAALRRARLRARRAPTGG